MYYMLFIIESVKMYDAAVSQLHTAFLTFY